MKHSVVSGHALEANHSSSPVRQRPAFRGRPSLLTHRSSPPAGPQLELSLDAARLQAGAVPRLSRSRRQRHLDRALWWFQHMRQVVESACDWQPAPQPPPEQIWFPNAHQQPGRPA